MFWGAALALVEGGLLISGGTSAIQTAMVIGALPFSVVMVLMCIVLIKAIYNDGRREAAGVATTTAEMSSTPAELLVCHSYVYAVSLLTMGRFHLTVFPCIPPYTMQVSAYDNGP